MAHSDATKARALTAYRGSGNVSAATQSAGVSREVWYRWLKDDPAFAALVADAREEAIDALEAKAMERGKAESDTLLIFLLKSLRRGQYGDKQTLEIVSPEVTSRLERQVALIAARPTWQTDELLSMLDTVWAA